MSENLENQQINEPVESAENQLQETLIAPEAPVAATEEDDDDDWWKDEDEYTKSEYSEMEDLYNSTLKEFHENEIVEAEVVSIGEKETVVNIGFKSEGIIPNSEFRDTPDIKPGDSVQVFIESVEDSEGQLQLSRRRAKRMRTWEKINSALDEDVILNGLVERRTKGGFVVDISGVEAFLPGSQIDVKPVEDFDAYVGKTMEFKVVKINQAYENVVVSHKVLLEAELEEQRQNILENLEKGQVLEGEVKNMTNFGVFIDLGGVDGLLHITDISWGRINHPEEVLDRKQKVQVVVLDFDEEKKRISLGMKQLTAHPWDSLPETISEGTVVKGKVVTVADYGVFLEVMPGVEGLIHTSEMSWSQHVKNPNETYEVGQELDAVVLNIDREERKMSLGLKQLSEDPWSQVPEKYPEGSKHSGKVRNMTTYGLFVELEEGVDGLVHISDLSWTRKYNHPSEFIKVGEELEVVVLSTDMENRRLSLGHKQLTEDLWDTFSDIFNVGTVHKGTIKKIDNKGARVELEYGVEGSVPSSHLKTAEGAAELKADDTVDLMVIEFNKDAKKLVLSHSRTWQSPEEVASTKRRRGGSRSGGGGGNAVPPQQTTTTLGEIDALAALKAKMEASEGGEAEKPKKKAAKAKKEEAPVEASAEEVVEATTEALENAAEEVVETVEAKAEEAVEAVEAKVEEVAEAAPEEASEEEKS
jgi:small subunit ribosomal protein S1